MDNVNLTDSMLMPLAFRTSSIDFNDQPAIKDRSRILSLAFAFEVLHTHTTTRACRSQARWPPLPPSHSPLERHPRTSPPRRAAAWRSIRRRRSHRFSSRFHSMSVATQRQPSAHCVSHGQRSLFVDLLSLGRDRHRSRSCRDGPRSDANAAAEIGSRAHQLSSTARRCATAVLSDIDEDCPPSANLHPSRRNPLLLPPRHLADAAASPRPTFRFR
jgi:hypothetical protein